MTMKIESINRNRPKALVIRLAAIFLLTTISGCDAQEPAPENPLKSEQELAKNNVWHAAKLRGVAFRAVGQEPGWLLEIRNGEEILLVTDYGQNRIPFPYIDPQEDKTARKTVFPLNESSNILIEGKPCTDSMSGEAFEVTVTITLDSKTLRGCGRALF